MTTGAPRDTVKLERYWVDDDGGGETDILKECRTGVRRVRRKSEVNGHPTRDVQGRDRDGTECRTSRGYRDPQLGIETPTST